MSFILGIDLGGSQIKTVCLEVESGRRLRETVRTTPEGHRGTGVPSWAEAVREEVRAVEADIGDAETVGLCAPGLSAADGRSVACMPGRLAGLEGLDWTSFLNRRELVPVLNDAHAALVGEARVGAARGLRNVYMLTLGTGVGGAVMMGGGLMRGHIGRAGHLGHMTVDLDGPPDITGLPGGLEDFVGDCTVRARTGGRFGSTLELVEAVAGGDREAGVCWQRSMHALACGIASLNNILDPEAVILGGGIVGAGAQLLGPLREALARVEWRPLGCGVPLRLAQLGEWAGAVGAAFNGLERARELKRGRAADPT